MGFGRIHVAPHPHHNPVNISNIPYFLSPFLLLRLTNWYGTVLDSILIRPQITISKHRNVPNLLENLHKEVMFIS